MLDVTVNNVFLRLSCFSQSYPGQMRHGVEQAGRRCAWSKVLQQWMDESTLVLG